MSYYMAGDYYQTGDLFGFIKGAVRTVGRVASATGIPGISQAGGLVNQILTPQIQPPAPGRRSFGAHIPQGQTSTSGVQIGPVLIGRRTELGPRITEGEVVGFPDMPGVPMRRKRRTMNYGNTRALRRADRRINGFVKVAKSALKHTNYKVVTKQTGTRKRAPVSVSRNVSIGD